LVQERLQPFLIRLGLDVAAGPQTALAGQGLPAPRRLAGMIRRELDLEPPPRVASGFTTVAGPALVLGGIGLAAWFVSLWPLFLWLPVFPVVWLDQGGWTRDWATLGSLSDAVAAHNIGKLAAMGARSDEAEWWKQFAVMFCAVANDEGKAITDYRMIDRSTRFHYV
jgi:hypothetical protein